MLGWGNKTQPTSSAITLQDRRSLAIIPLLSVSEKPCIFWIPKRR